MIIRNNSKNCCSLTIAISGLSSSGKSYSSLMLADGLVGLSNTVIIDTEKSIDLYSKLGNFKVLDMMGNYSPENYIKAINKSEESGAKCIIIDSLSHVWEFILQENDRLSGNKFSNWRKLAPRYQNLIQRILASDSHIIVTLRSKEKYTLKQDSRDRMVPISIGIKPIIRKDFEYECSIHFEINTHNYSKAIKDRTQLFENHLFKIEKRTGQILKLWLNSKDFIADMKTSLKHYSSTEIQDFKSKYPKLSLLFKEQLELINSPKLKSSQNGQYK